jgi:hypothetical protein
LREAGILGRETPEQSVRQRVSAYTSEGMDDQAAIQKVYEDLNRETSAALDAGDDALYDSLTDMEYAVRQWWDSGTMADNATGMDPSAGSILQELERSLAEKSNIMGQRNPAGASEALRAAGIKGIRYKDAGSRSAEGGTSNYVVFDDSTINILKKYGLAGLTAGGAGAGLLGSPDTASASQSKYVTGGRF